MAESLKAALDRQDQLITRRQALAYLTEAEIDSRLGRRWQVVLPGIYATFTGALTRRHRLRAALLHAGEGAMLTDLDALRLYRLPYLPDDSFTRVLVAAAVQRLSRDYVLIRRTTRLPRPTIIDGFPVVPLDRAVADFALRHADERETVAVAAAAVQKRKVSIEQLSQEARRGPARGRPRLVRVINQLQAGVRSAPEADFRNLVVASRVLPDALWNALLLLPDGTKVSPDALFVGAGLVHEVNSREFHSPEKAGEDVFEDMQRRSDAMVTGGLTVLHNSPNRVANEGRTVISQVETCYQRDAGKGLPPGVVILRAGPPGTPSNVALPPEMAG